MSSDNLTIFDCGIEVELLLKPKPAIEAMNGLLPTTTNDGKKEQNR